MSVEDPAVIVCSISGSLANREQCPAIPYTPEEYGAEARRIVDEGGVMIHIHARKPDGTPSYEIEDFEAIRSAAPTDPDIAALWNRIQTEYRANQRAIVETLAEKGALGPGLDVERAADILWTINNPDVWQLLVGRRGWTAESYERWCGDLACAQLLRSGT